MYDFDVKYYGGCNLEFFGTSWHSGRVDIRDEFFGASFSGRVFRDELTFGTSWHSGRVDTGRVETVPVVMHRFNSYAIRPGCKFHIIYIKCMSHVLEFYVTQFYTTTFIILQSWNHRFWLHWCALQVYGVYLKRLIVFTFVFFGFDGWLVWSFCWRLTCCFIRFVYHIIYHIIYLVINS